MLTRVYYNLKKLDGRRFSLRRLPLSKNIRELEKFLESEPHFRTETFAKRMLFSREIQTNNLVEGYGDDIETINRVIADAEAIQERDKRARILNLYHAYKFILTGGEIDKESLRTLYEITSKDALDDYSMANMGRYYRDANVYIMKSGLDLDFREGLPCELIEEFMDSYFSFLNNHTDGTETEEYLKSQILHLYFVYIHPYFDVNGRTSRTLSMWYLLNKKAYPYVIFNRGISFNRSAYYDILTKSIDRGDLTYFINLMLETVKIELEKEYVMEALASDAKANLNETDYQTLLYLLSIKGPKTVQNFSFLYNRITQSRAKSPAEIYKDMIVPLLDKGVLDSPKSINDRTPISTKESIDSKILTLRPLKLDKNKISHLRF